jgi:hypothetical protein
MLKTSVTDSPIPKKWKLPNPASLSGGLIVKIKSLYRKKTKNGGCQQQSLTRDGGGKPPPHLSRT